MDTEQIKAIVEKFKIPFCELTLANLAKQIFVTNKQDKIQIDIVIGFPLSEANQIKIKEFLLLELKTVLSLKEKIIIEIKSEINAYKTQVRQTIQSKIKNIILVGSGKGGVGKSTLTANLALALKAQGAQVGILDADIYGPSQPQIMGNFDTPEVLEGKKFKPLNCYGMPMISIGNLVDLDSAMIWRGPMVSQALRQLLNDTQWPELDYLLVDLPPGTGDIQLTIAKEVPVSGSIVVTTPQDLSLLDARRAIEMFRKVNIPILGIVENMSTFICPNCKHEEPIFGHSGGEQLAGNIQVPLLGGIPLSMKIRQAIDSAKPTVVSEPNSIISQAYEKIIIAALAYLSVRPKSQSFNIPKVKVEYSKE
ncbi:iron-sulfur cluster carrier protein ApbC [Thiotrichales bacterium 19S11-10]|nr:iron-sulfur cluster carrier protein ApbC [Thiotrichales bacterium 19S11-10]